MKRHTRAVGFLIVALAATGASTWLSGPAGAIPASPGSSSSPAYRHGTVAPVGTQTTTSGPRAFASTANDLFYGGAIDGVGVTTGPPKVYLVFYGSQWNTQGSETVGGHTYATFTGDPTGIAPDLQAFFTGLGTGGETWSGVMTQYCEGSAATGLSTCPAGTTNVGYPTGGALAGVWEDTSVSSPSQATAAQLAAEAEKAAGHFGNTSTAANRNDQYFIVSPHNTHPDGFNTPSGQFCAWHDYTADPYIVGVTQTNGIVAFTNMPYVTDMGTSCGAYFVNMSSGIDDGVTIVGGHEYAETITDQFPAGGWTDSSGYENGDKCAWISSGQGAANYLTLPTGNFPVQSTWANDFNGGSGGCELSHAVVSGNKVTVTNPGNQQSTQNVAISPSLQIVASDSASGQTLTYSATGLPAGLTIDPASGAISGTPSADVLNAPVTVTVTDGTGASGGASFSWTVNSSGNNTVTVTNPGTQTSTQGTAIAPLQISASDSQTGQTLTYSATGLPAGLSISSSGQITGTPSGTGTSSVNVTVKDTTTGSGGTSFSWTVNPKPAGNTVTVTNPGNQTSTRYQTVSLQIQAKDSASGQTLTYTASGLPSGISINHSTGLISGRARYTATYSVTVTVTDTTGANGKASFTWTILHGATTHSGTAGSSSPQAHPHGRT